MRPLTIEPRGIAIGGVKPIRNGRLHSAVESSRPVRWTGKSRGCHAPHGATATGLWSAAATGAAAAPDGGRQCRYTFVRATSR